MAQISSIADEQVSTPLSSAKSILLRISKFNPEYDDSQSESYSTREDRDEWHIVGLLGQIPITKGQPTGNWIKMKDVSDTVEMYFVK